MLDYTIAAFSKIIEDFKKLGFWFIVGTNLAYIGYLIYAIATTRGELWVDIPLLVFSAVYLAFYLYATRFGKELDGKKSLQKNSKKIFGWAKKLMKFYTLAATLYSLTGVSQGADVPYILLTAAQVMFFLLQIVIEIITALVNKYADMVKTAITMDVEQVTKPVKSVTNFFKKMSGKEVEEDESEPTKMQEMLNARVQTAREKKAQMKEEKRLEKELLKQQKRDAKNEAKNASAATETPTEAPDQVIEIAEEIAISATAESKETPKKKGFFRRK